MKTKSGFEFEIKEEKLNDMRVIELIASVDSDIRAVPKLLTLMFGEDGKERLYQHVAEEDGRVPIEKVTDEITEIFTTVESGKNS